MKHVDQGSAIAWSAVLRDGIVKLGTIADDGRGSGAQFHPCTDTGQRVMNDFVAQCRAPDGEPLTEEFVSEALADEYQYARTVAMAEREHAYVVRTYDKLDVPEILTFTLRPGKAMDYAEALRAAHRLSLSEPIRRAELWMGAAKGWVEFLRRHSDQ
nr:hypothetical protein [Nocardiopsis mwathae]